MQNMNSVSRKPDVTLTIKMFNISGWIILGFSTFYMLFGIIMIFVVGDEPYDPYIGSYLDYWSNDGMGMFIGILSLIKDMIFYGMFPGFVILGIGYHLKKVWQSSHYPW